MTMGQSIPAAVDTSQPVGPFAGRQPASRIDNLAIVLERLWKFYEAMRSGKPLTDADQMLAQMGTALSHSAMITRGTVPAESCPAEANESQPPNALAAGPC
jgi:hypothetical protein